MWLNIIIYSMYSNYCLSWVLITLDFLFVICHHRRHDDLGLRASRSDGHLNRQLEVLNIKLTIIKKSSFSLNYFVSRVSVILVLIYGKINVKIVYSYFSKYLGKEDFHSKLLQSDVLKK